ncbi:bifunctional 4-hydroxy-2-oxoglutarate aldolase/2-dehydro-3-deoxy-phosphogluconate aldolase [Hutsoniella sourekii]|uniref:bifunctional 4-hydroxy-2-oxoglutarate aldolase/2-dehydro-3-deoxy-phosphogluconate aldolase n=1 Tax=Hutsoniella sourekii TaxID=87650 RepID=UPI0004872C37|nr:bifunctional 4-hydroxy-2-oxoglutarate aldolase/2-dehydro-3-deoxy-phosphogluconate aldolase [Hutsoniella sourekii]
MISNEALRQQLHDKKLLPLYTATELAVLDQVEDLLIQHDLPMIEVTYRSDLASKAIKQLASSDRLVVGAGTVRSLDQAKEAVDHGAQFIVCPALVTSVVEYCCSEGIPVYPGTVTPSEIQAASEYGLNLVKFFPADVYGGVQAIKALSGPFFDMEFLPTGGVNQANLEEYLSNDKVVAVGGSFILSEKDVLNAPEQADSNLAALTEIVNKLSK